MTLDRGAGGKIIPSTEIQKGALLNHEPQSSGMGRISTKDTPEAPTPLHSLSKATVKYLLVLLIQHLPPFSGNCPGTPLGEPLPHCASMLFREDQPHTQLQMLAFSLGIFPQISETRPLLSN